ncbi:MAG: efflux RND transporter periplasmic adaptor subunit [Candidatus Competibacteraceae bacterium]|nr:MAG: efflux RND transporter periplasmic adaptor subunit [Candidatus Competibacteraceae bacterium]
MRLIPQLGIVILLAALAAGGGWYWTAESERGDEVPSARPASAVAVETTPARLGTVTETVAAVGTARATSSVKIVPSTAGRITRIAFQAGQRVQSGATLVELDSASERAAVREAESELANLRLQVRRADSLRAQRLVSAADLDDLRAKLDMAEARLEAARSRLEKRTVRAPFAGVVGLRNVNLGAYVDTDTALTTLDDLDTIELEFKVPERYFATVKPGQTVSAVSAAFPGRTFSGAVREVDTRIDSARAFRVRAELPNPDALLPDGLFMAVRLTVAERDHAVLVPEEAVVSEDGRSYVHVVAEGIATRTVIVTGQRRDAAIEVLTGLAPGAEVVTKGHQALRERSPVRPVDGSAKTAAALAPRGED